VQQDQRLLLEMAMVGLQVAATCDSGGARVHVLDICAKKASTLACSVMVWYSVVLHGWREQLAAWRSAQRRVLFSPRASKLRLGDRRTAVASALWLVRHGSWSRQRCETGDRWTLSPLTLHLDAHSPPAQAPAASTRSHTHCFAPTAACRPHGSRGPLAGETARILPHPTPSTPAASPRPATLIAHSIALKPPRPLASPHRSHQLPAFPPPSRAAPHLGLCKRPAPKKSSLASRRARMCRGAQ